MYTITIPLKDAYRDDLYQVANTAVLSFVLLEAVFNIVYDYFGTIDHPVPDSMADEYFDQSVGYIIEAIKLVDPLSGDLDEESQFVINELLGSAIGAITESIGEMNIGTLLEPVWQLTLNEAFTRDVNFNVHHGSNTFTIIFLDPEPETTQMDLFMAASL